MPLILICGQPCSGKSTAAATLCEALRATLQRDSAVVELLDEPSLNLDRNDDYKDGPSEKNLRGLLRSAVDRTVSREKFVIVDSLNNIKGYRYELWCLAKGVGTRYCLLHCDVSQQQAVEWNLERRERGMPSYNDSIMHDLVRRFERPDNRNRWDSPLFELHPATESADEGKATLMRLVTAMQGDSGGAGGAGGVRELQPTIATQNVKLSSTNLLYDLDRATQEVISVLLQAQGSSVEIGEGLPPVHLQRSVGLPELRRHKRTFLKLQSQTPLSGPPPPMDVMSAKRMFIDYLNRELSVG